MTRVLPTPSTSDHGRRPEDDHAVVILMRERDEARAEAERLRAATREAAELLSDIGTDDYVNPPTAEAMQRAAAELRALNGEAR